MTGSSTWSSLVGSTRNQNRGNPTTGGWSPTRAVSKDQIEATEPARNEESIEEPIREALASARLEGHEPSPEVIADLRLVGSGEIDFDEVLERIKDRHRS